MHGEMGIVDKEIGEKGTCFRFNVLLSAVNLCEDNTKLEQDIEIGIVDDQNPSRGQNVNHTPIASPRLNILGTSASPKVEGSYVVLLINNAERRRIVKKFMERLGIRTLVPERWEQLAPTLENMKNKKGHHSQHNSISGISDFGLQNCLIKSASCNSSSSFNRAKDVPLMSSMDESTDNTNNILSLFNKKSTGGNMRGASDRFILLTIDTTAGPFSKLCRIVNDSKEASQLVGTARLFG